MVGRAPGTPPEGPRRREFPDEISAARGESLGGVGPTQWGLRAGGSTGQCRRLHGTTTTTAAQPTKKQTERPAEPATVTSHRTQTQGEESGVPQPSSVLDRGDPPQGQVIVEPDPARWNPQEPVMRPQRVQHPTGSRPKQLCGTLFVDASGQAMRGTGLTPYPGEERGRETSHRQEACFPTSHATTADTSVFPPDYQPPAHHPTRTNPHR